MPSGKVETKATRDKAFSFYMIGLQHKEIAQRLGIKPDSVRQWSNRYRWPEIKAARTDKASKVLQTLHENSVADIIEQHEKRVSRVYEGKIDMLDKFQPVDSKEFVDVANALDKLDQVARRNLGMQTEQTSNATFQLNIGSWSVKKREAEVIDVTPPSLDIPGDSSASVEV